MLEIMKILSEFNTQEEFKKLLEDTINDLNYIKNRIECGEARVKYHDWRHMEVINEYVAIIREDI